MALEKGLTGLVIRMLELFWVRSSLEVNGSFRLIFVFSRDAFYFKQVLLPFFPPHFFLSLVDVQTEYALPFTLWVLLSVFLKLGAYH